MPDFVIVYPKTGFDIKGASVELPLSALSVASVLIDRRDVQIIDQRTDDNWQTTLKKALAHNPLAVGVSSMTGTQIKYGLDVARIVKDFPETKMIWGGVHATLLPEQTAENPLIDYVIVGDGEPPIPALLDSIEKERGFEKVPNLIYKKDQKIKKNQSGAQLNMDALSDIPFELVNINHYIDSRAMVNENVKRVLPFIGSRGCPFRCAFCCNPVLSKRRWRAMSPERVFEQVEAMVDLFNLDGITFHDENFFGNLKRAEKIAKMIKGRYAWSVQARMDDLARVDLKMFEKNGLSLVQPGIETGSPRIMKMIHKDESIPTILKANRKLAKTNITGVYNFMMGFPTEKLSEINQTVDLALKLIKENPNATLSGFYVFVPYPGSELYDLAVKEGQFSPPKTLEGWATYSRMHLNTPWIQDRIPLLKNLMFTSKFIDGKRMQNIFKKFHIPNAVMNSFSGRYRKKWEEKDFEDSIDIKLLHSFAKHYFKWE